MKKRSGAKALRRLNHKRGKGGGKIKGEGGTCDQNSPSGVEGGGLVRAEGHDPVRAGERGITPCAKKKKVGRINSVMGGEFGTTHR